MEKCGDADAASAIVVVIVRRALVASSPARRSTMSYWLLPPAAIECDVSVRGLACLTIAYSFEQRAETVAEYLLTGSIEHARQLHGASWEAAAGSVASAKREKPRGNNESPSVRGR